VEYATPRPVTIADAIEMTKLADPTYGGAGSSAGRVAQFSPDGRKFVVVVKKGNLKNNTNEYSILLWRTEEVFRSPKPDVLLTMVSSSNRLAVRSVTWCNDDEMMFLGEHRGELQQVYSFNIRTRRLTKLTNSASNVIGFSRSRERSISYIAEELLSNGDQKAPPLGRPITNQLITEVLLGHPDEYWSDHVRLCMQSDGTKNAVKTLSDRILMPFPSADSRPVTSPNGQYLLLLATVERIPASWRGYRDALMQKWTSWKTTPGQYSMLKQYLLFDTRTGESRVLLDAPVGLAAGERSEAAWAPDSQSVVISSTYLPLDGITEEERAARIDRPFAVEVRVPSDKLTKVSSDELKLINWEADSNQLVFEDGRGNQDFMEASKVFFQKRGDSWERVPGNSVVEKRPEIRLEEGMNSPPHIVAIEPDTKEKALLLDLNPQFKTLKFGKEEQIRWKATDGHEVEGGLYYPVDYVPGKRYPLVIQTHGFRPDRFQIDGPYTSVFAAQPLAGKGIMVLQAEKPDRAELIRNLATPKEADWKMSAYEGAIDYLDHEGLIDRARVGIAGFSRSCWHVKYTLTHSHYRFAAAGISDGFDLGYFGYVSMANRSYPDNEIDQIVGTAPTGAGLNSWLERSPGFNADKVPSSTPQRIVASYPLDVLVEWEWFAMMKRLGKPVDMVVFLDGVHVLEKPLNRMISQGGYVDWFDFWLNGHEDTDPTKAEQYRRWRELREMIRAGNP
jgi:dipeptidyl aminopeptidase/acylaminoacyl peptidase